MTVVNGKELLDLAPILDMVPNKRNHSGVSWGLTEAGYDIRIKQTVTFMPRQVSPSYILRDNQQVMGRFVLASAMEEFRMPTNLVGKVHDKSTWARKGLSVFNTVIEPGWRGNLTLELVFHGTEQVTIPAGSGIAQVLFFRLEEEALYNGKYQDQADGPIAARFN